MAKVFQHSTVDSAGKIWISLKEKKDLLVLNTIFLILFWSSTTAFWKFFFVRLNLHRITQTQKPSSDFVALHESFRKPFLPFLYVSVHPWYVLVSYCLKQSLDSGLGKMLFLVYFRGYGKKYTLELVHAIQGEALHTCMRDVLSQLALNLTASCCFPRASTGLSAGSGSCTGQKKKKNNFLLDSIYMKALKQPPASAQRREWWGCTIHFGSTPWLGTLGNVTNLHPKEQLLCVVLFCQEMMYLLLPKNKNPM